jgi:tripartite-type tricarboxylate transporter receptor subunit TctC
MKPSRIRAAVLSAALLALPQLAAAQEWPSKAVKIVVPFAPGGGSDFIARYVARRLSEELKQPFIVENKPGAGGNIGTEQGIKSPPDGYTLTLIASSYTVNASVYKLNFDPINDITPIIQVSQGPLVIVVNPKVPAKDLKELVALAKAKPDEVNYASSGPGSIVHAASELFNMTAGTKMTHVPYKGSGPALNDLISGQVDLMFDQLPSSLAQVQGGRLKAVAVTSRARTSIAPDIPTIAESGLPAFEATSWWAVFAPPKTPPEIVDKLNAVIHQALADPKLLATFTGMGLEVWRSTPAELSQLLVDERLKWQKVIIDNNIEVN